MLSSTQHKEKLHSMPPRSLDASPFLLFLCENHVVSIDLPVSHAWFPLKSQPALPICANDAVSLAGTPPVAAASPPVPPVASATMLGHQRPWPPTPVRPPPCALGPTRRGIASYRCHDALFCGGFRPPLRRWYKRRWLSAPQADSNVLRYQAAPSRYVAENVAHPYLLPYLLYHL
jgi:hypothetical protein